MKHRTLWLALGVSSVLLAIRCYAAERLGFGDAEALYACYARHPQPAYRDHPGLIGLVARMLGDGDSPSPVAAHRVTAWLATFAPWSAALAARAAGASPRGALAAALALMVVPEIAIGLFGLTPDLPLILLWYLALACAAAALPRAPGSVGALALHLGAGAAAGLACDAKASGVLLLMALAITWAGPSWPHRRTAAPWAAMLVAAMVLSPVVIDEVQRGFPMLRHRLVDTQQHAGFSLRNVAALLGGQLLYVTPPIVVAAWLVGRDLFRHRRNDPHSTLLWWTTAACTPLVVLACYSPVAEPHWVAPLYLAMPIHLARRIDAVPALLGRKLSAWALSLGAVMVALAHTWVLAPIGPRWLGSRYVARYDLANDLVAWREGLPAVRQALAASLQPEAPPVIVVGPHWTVCAQLHAGLPASVLVGCEANVPDDFTDWLPPSTWERAPVLLYVTDDRFGVGPPLLPTRRADALWRVAVQRGGRVVRTISITRLVNEGRATNP